MVINSNDILKFFNNKKVFITGHTGFKGAWLSYILDLNGAKTKGYSLSPNTIPSLYNSLVFSSNHESVIADIRDFNCLKEEIENFNPEFIFHLAAQPLVIESYNNPKYNFETNFNGTLNILEAIRVLNLECTCILITTDKVYENTNENRAFVESDKLGGKDPYSASKAACEILINSYNHSFLKNSSVKIASVRAGNVIGGGDWSENRLIPDIVRSIFENKELIIRNPNATRPWQHVLEPLLGYLKLSILLNEKTELSSAWNFGPESNTEASVNDLIDIITPKIKNLNIQINKNPIHSEARTLSLDIEKAKKELSWEPKWNLKETIFKTIKWYKLYYEGLSTNILIENDLKSYIQSDGV